MTHLSAISKVSEDQKDEKPEEKTMELDEHLREAEKKIISLGCCKISINKNWRENIPKFTDTIEPQSKFLIIYLKSLKAIEQQSFSTPLNHKVSFKSSSQHH